MNLDKIREKVRSYIGINNKFIYRGSRNQIEEFEGVIIKCFPYVFLIQTENEQIKSFTYNDFIIKNIKILEK